MERNRMETIYRKYSDAVFRTAFAYLKNPAEAEDITAEVFLKYFTLEKSIPDESYEKAWLLRVTINKCKDILRSFRIKKRVSLENEEPTYEIPEETEVYLAVMNLPKKYRIVIHLFYFEGYSTEEIGEITLSSGQAVRTRLSRARNMLKKSLGKEFHI